MTADRQRRVLELADEVVLGRDTWSITLPNGIEYEAVLRRNGGVCTSTGCVTLGLPHGSLKERCSSCLAQIWDDVQQLVGLS